MKAITQLTYGSVDQLSYVDVERPEPGDDEVLIHVRAAGLSPGDRAMVTGIPYVNRLAASGIRRPKNPIPGFDVAGIVHAAGLRATRFTVGDVVFGIAPGSFAEYVTTTEGQLAHKPTSWSFAEAAAVPESGSVALQAVRDQARVHRGDRVAVIGAGGGVGAYVVQVAKSFGGHVTGVCGSGVVEQVEALGADDVVDYTRADVYETDESFDIIIDTAGKTPLRQLRQALSRRGRLVIVGADHSHRVTGGLGRWLRALLWSPFTTQTMRPFPAKPVGQRDLARLGELMVSGELVPVVDRTFPLEAAADAMRYLDYRQGVGKVVVVV